MKVYGQLEYGQFHNLSASPSAGKKGLVLFNTTDGKAYLDNGATVRSFLINDDKAIIGTSGTAGTNVRFHRGGTAVLQFVLGSDVTAEGTLSTTLAKISGKMEAYATASLPAAGNAGRIAWDTDLLTLKVDNGASWDRVTPTGSTQYAAIVSNPAITGFSTHTSLATAISAVSAGDQILYMGDTTENITVSKQVDIVGMGRGSVLTGNITFSSGSNYSSVRNLKFTGSLTVDSGSIGNRVVDCFCTISTFTNNDTTRSTFLDLQKE